MVRIEVDADGTSHITVRHGEADVSTEKGSEKVSGEYHHGCARGDGRSGISGGGRSGARRMGWLERTARYVSAAGAIAAVCDLRRFRRRGFGSLWALGLDPAYGWVWVPTVAASWAPYQNGQWVWEDYYGWTWVDYAPWGWAPFHYGNWYIRAGLGWAWYPGPRIGHVWWRPAMVGFFGWGGVSESAWARLRICQCRLGTAGSVMKFSGPGMDGEASSGGAVWFGSQYNGHISATPEWWAVSTAVSAADFQRGNFRNTVAVDRATLPQASLVRGTVPVSPTSQNLRFSNRTASVQCSRRRRFFQPAILR